MSKCVILLSGGLDSTVLVYSLVNEFEVYPLTINYGQKHNKEVLAARNVCEARDHNLLLRWKYQDLSVLRTLLPSALTGVGEIPAGHYEDVSMKQTVVPNRNMILLAIASGYAQGIGAKYVAYAAHHGDHAIYPDCRPEFVQALRDAIRLGTGWSNDGIELLTPFVGKSKADVVGIGKKLNVPFRLTWSCYQGGEVHCGYCGTCTERKEAFKLAGVEDPTKYIAEKLERRLSNDS
jgi:7-cyano-7-deazaguanine synthase